MGYGPDVLGLFVGNAGFFPVYSIQTGSWSAQPPNQWVPGGSSPEAKQEGGEADHSTPSSAKVVLYLHSAMCLHGTEHN
jgi:hypothetical protein